MRLEFAVLGPLQVRAGTYPVVIAGDRQRLILAALMLNANRRVLSSQNMCVLAGAWPATV